MQLFFIAATVIWVQRFRRDIGNLNAMLWDINNEIVIHAVALDEAGMITLPWEAIEEDCDNAVDLQEDCPKARRDGNVYYLDESD